MCIYVCVRERKRKKANDEGTVWKERSKIDSTVTERVVECRRLRGTYIAVSR
jgi:hypothetical protein